MIKKFTLICLFLFTAFFSETIAKERKSHIIGFYNLENLFDIYHDDGKNDYEFLPGGANQ